MVARRPPSNEATVGAMKEAARTATMHATEEPRWMACEDCEASGHPPGSQSSSG